MEGHLKVANVGFNNSGFERVLRSLTLIRSGIAVKQPISLDAYCFESCSLMAIHKTALPNASDELFITDGGLETTWVFLEGYELPCFAAFHLLKEEQGYGAIKDYYKRYPNIAKELKTGFILESPTWRATPDWPDERCSSAGVLAIAVLNKYKPVYAKTFGYKNHEAKEAT